MQAIILAAGMGKRLKDYTKNNTKCMVEVCGQTLIERALRDLDSRGLSRIVLVIGYKGRELRDFVDALRIKTPILYVNNPVYDRTNNIYSLYLAKDYLVSEDTLLLESDIIFESAVLDELIQDPRESLVLVDHYESWMDGTCLKLREDDSIEAFIPGKKLQFQERSLYFKTVNLYKFSKLFSSSRYVPFLEAYSKALGNNEYYEQVLKVLAVLEDAGIYAKRLSGQKWYEIDDAQDLAIASTLFAKGPEKLRRMQASYGGYWRYPSLKDFCYLVNPFFPSHQMKEEMKASYDALLGAYPSGMGINSFLAAKMVGLPEEMVIVGNGAAELIKACMEMVAGRIGIIRPSFEEYGHRVSEERLVVYSPKEPDYSYTVSDIKAFFQDKDIQNLVVINPDNPSGNYLDASSVKELFEFTKEKNITLIYDESFSDFACEEERSMLREELLSKYPNVFVVKSFSKSYGIPGLRLGIMACADMRAVDILKKEVAIWNINSFAEHFMQIFGKYENDYANSTRLVAAEREWLSEELGRISGIRVIPSQANYIMARLEGITAPCLTERLLEEHNILIKDLSAKTDGSYVRIAIRSREDNQVLVRALAEIMK